MDMFCTLRACPQINERVAKEMAPESVSSDGDRKLSSVARGPTAAGHFQSLDHQKCAPVSCHSRRAVD